MLRILTTAEKLHCKTPFAEQLFAVYLLVEHLSMADSIKLLSDLTLFKISYQINSSYYSDYHYYSNTYSNQQRGDTYPQIIIEIVKCNCFVILNIAKEFSFI